jgi:lipid-binding SYLF domain-containing protein
MTTIRRGIVLAALGLLATAAGAVGPRPGELGERLRKATAVLSEMASGKQDTDIPREMLARARAIAVFPGVKKAGARPPSSPSGAGASASSSVARSSTWCSWS